MNSDSIGIEFFIGMVTGGIMACIITAGCVADVGNEAIDRIHDDAVRYGHGQYVPSPSGGPVFKWNIPEGMNDE